MLDTTKVGRRDAALDLLLAYWRARARPGGGLPGRADFDPAEMRFALGHLVLVDVEREPTLRFRHRLIGTHVVERAGYDATGLHLDEIPERQLAARLAESYVRAVETRQPVRDRIDEVLDGRATRLELLRLPLARDGRTVDMVLSAVYFERAA